MSKITDLREQVESECLACALELLKSETTPTAATVGTVSMLVSIANSVAEQNRFPALETRERRGICEDLGSQGPEVLISRYESEIRQLTRRVEKLKAGASPADVVS